MTWKTFQHYKNISPEKANTQLQQIIEEIFKACQAVAPYSVSTLRFRTTIPPENIVLNREISMDLIYLNNRPLLHIFTRLPAFKMLFLCALIPPNAYGKIS